jgi:hypothetical protein
MSLKDFNDGAFEGVNLLIKSVICGFGLMIGAIFAMGICGGLLSFLE